jgi:MraZ protein
MSHMESLCQKVDQMPWFSEDQENWTATLFADAISLPFDQDGRIMLPDHLWEFLGSPEHINFVGCGRTFQIWDPRAFHIHQENARQRLRQHMKEGLRAPS